MPEGDLTKTQSQHCLRADAGLLCRCYHRLESYLLLGKGEDLTGGRKRTSVVSDAMEAVIGAIYLDGGLASAKEYHSQVHFK
ncbi:MAG: ribonuclease III domain-containing protein [Pilosibacter sp.]